MYKPNNVLIHLQNKSRDDSDKTILKRDNTNNIDKTKAKDYGKEELDDVANGAQSMIKGCIVEDKAYRLYDINGNFLVDCGTNSRAARVQKLLKEGKINLDMVMMVFNTEDGKKKVAANKATDEDFNWDNVPIGSAD